MIGTHQEASHTKSVENVEIKCSIDCQLSALKKNQDDSSPSFLHCHKLYNWQYVQFRHTHTHFNSVEFHLDCHFSPHVARSPPHPHVLMMKDPHLSCLHPWNPLFLATLIASEIQKTLEICLLGSWLISKCCWPKHVKCTSGSFLLAPSRPRAPRWTCDAGWPSSSRGWPGCRYGPVGSDGRFRGSRGIHQITKSPQIKSA